MKFYRKEEKYSPAFPTNTEQPQESVKSSENPATKPEASPAVNNIVGNITQGASNALAKAPAAKAETGGFQYGASKPSDTVAQAEALLQQQMAQKPGTYQSTWQDQLNDTINQILNRDKFSYDLNGDAIYQQYADQYIQQGKMAMMDTMGQAQAMTGGYGNSYAQSAGQQAYQSYLQQLNEVVPELYGMALDKYNQEGRELYNQAALIGQQEDQEYGRYQDALNQWQNERDFAYDYLLNNRNYQYQQSRDTIADQQWQTEFDEAQRQYDEQMGLTREQWEWEKEQAELQKAAQSGTEGNNILLWRETGTYDDDGNRVFINSDGKTQSFGEGVNPYTGTKNPDAQNGTFSNGYQPNNVASFYFGSKKLTADELAKCKLSKSGFVDVVNGKTQNVWKTPDGKLWIWDGTQNKYLKYEN